VTRIEPLPVEEWGEEARRVLPAYLRRPELYLSDGPEAQPMPGALGLLAHQLPLGQGWLAFNEVLAQQTALDVRLRELVVLRVAWRTRSAYEWAQHVRIGHQAGLSTEQLHAIPAGPAHDEWAPVERVVLAATDEMIDDHAVGDRTFDQLTRFFSDAELLELLFVAGAYLCFAVVTNSARLRPDPPTEPIDAPTMPAGGG
jgi:alkylhydroperoxidase family enzyme